jgi:hypothetical protein
MKSLFAFIIFFIANISVYACDACEKQQPQILRGITHGAGPQSNWDYLIVSVAAAIVVATLFLSIKSLLSPGEKGEKHIKRIVLNYE